MIDNYQDRLKIDTQLKDLQKSLEECQHIITKHQETKSTTRTNNNNNNNINYILKQLKEIAEQYGLQYFSESGEDLAHMDAMNDNNNNNPHLITASIASQTFLIDVSNLDPCCI